MTACFIDSGLQNGNFLNSDISQSSVVTQLSYDGIINKGFVANLLVNLSVKEFRKSVNIWRSYGQYCSGLFFIDSQCRIITERKVYLRGSQVVDCYRRPMEYGRPLYFALWFLSSFFFFFA